MRHPRSSFLAVSTYLGALASVAACGGEVPDIGVPGGGGSGGAGGAGGAGGGVPADCTVVLKPTANDAMSLQTALTAAMSNDVICLGPGTYRPNAELSLNATGVTIRGIGATRDDVVIDFADQVVGDEGLVTTADGFTIESLSIKNSPGDGVVVRDAEDVTFRDIKVSWDAGSVAENGAYAVYPIGCTRVLIEDCEIVGASDAGVYVGQSTQIIVRNNDVHGNVAGIEIENSTLAEVYGNRAYDNTAGILVFVLPRLTKKDGITCNVHDNEIYDNNRENFASIGIVADVPKGIGVLIFAGDATEVHGNDIHGNGSLGIAVVSYDTFSQLSADFMDDDPETDGEPEVTYIYDNTFADNGTDPELILNGLLLPEPLPDVIWDGQEDTPGSGQFCLGMTPPARFTTLNGAMNLGMPANYSTDPTPFLCDHPQQPPVTLE